MRSEGHRPLPKEAIYQQFSGNKNEVVNLTLVYDEKKEPKYLTTANQLEKLMEFKYVEEKYATSKLSLKKEKSQSRKEKLIKIDLGTQLSR